MMSLLHRQQIALCCKEPIGRNVFRNVGPSHETSVSIQRGLPLQRRRQLHPIGAASCAAVTAVVATLAWTAPAGAADTSPPGVLHISTFQSPLPTDLPSATPTAEVPPHLPGLPDPWAEPGQTTLISPFHLDKGEISIPYDITSDGRQVLLHSTDATLHPNVYLYYVASRSEELVSVDSSGQRMSAVSPPSMSDDGNRIAFGTGQAWVRDRRTKRTWMVSIARNGKPGQAPSGGVSLSGDGKWVSMLSSADLMNDGAPLPHNAVNAYLVSVDQPGAIFLIGSATGPGSEKKIVPPCVSYDGRYVAYFTADVNSNVLVWRWDRMTNATLPASIDTDGSPINSVAAVNVRYIDDSGNQVVFTDGQRVFRHTMTTGVTDLLSVDYNGLQGRLQSWIPTISHNGQFVTFATLSPLVRDDTNLAPNPRDLPYGLIGEDVYVAHMQAGGHFSLARESVASDGTQSNDNGGASVVSDDGRVTVFMTGATDFAPDTPDGGLFIRTRSAAALDASQPVSPLRPARSQDRPTVRW